MAVVVLGVSITDENAQSKRVNWHIPLGALTLAEINTHLTTMTGLIDAIVGGVVSNPSFTIEGTMEGGVKAVATAGHPIGMGLNAGFSASGTNYRYTIHLPSFLESKLSGLSVNGDDIDWQAWRDAMVTGTPDGAEVVLPSDAYENDLTGVLATAFLSRKST